MYIYIYIALERNKPIRNSKMLRVPQVFHHVPKQKKNAPCSFPHGAQPGDGLDDVFMDWCSKKWGPFQQKASKKKLDPRQRCADRKLGVAGFVSKLFPIMVQILDSHWNEIIHRVHVSRNFVRNLIAAWFIIPMICAPLKNLHLVGVIMPQGPSYHVLRSHTIFMGFKESP